MRKINTRDFRVATRSTARDINRRIALNLVREHQPISRADLARRMSIRRGVVSILVNELIAEGLIYEGATGETARGRKPTFLHLRTRDRLVIAVDLRFSRTYLMLSDFSGREVALEIFKSVLDPAEVIDDLSSRIRRMLRNHRSASVCEGVGVVVPGIVEHESGRIINAPTLGWRGVDFREGLATKTGLPVFIENAAKACALAHMWLGIGESEVGHNFAYVSVSDGIGVGLIVNGELVRGSANIAGEFGHVPLSIDGPECTCGSRGCWEAYTSNIATLSRYFGRNLSEKGSNGAPAEALEDFTIEDLISRARSGDKKALAAIQQTGTYLGMGLATLVNALNPERIYLGGEITASWDLIADSVREALSQRALTEEAARTPVSISTAVEYPRLRGAAALVTAPTFAAPRVA